MMKEEIKPSKEEEERAYQFLIKYFIGLGIVSVFIVTIFFVIPVIIPK